MDLVSHLSAQRAVNDLMPLYHALAGEFTGHDLGFEMMAVSRDRHARARQAALYHLFDIFRLHHDLRTQG